MVSIKVVVEITTFVPYSTMKYRFSSLTLKIFVTEFAEQYKRAVLI